MAHPIFHPVTLKVLPAVLTVIVLSHIPSNFEKSTIGFP